MTQQQQQPFVIHTKEEAEEIIKEYNNHKKEEAYLDAKKRAGHRLSLAEIDQRETHFYESQKMKYKFDAASEYIANRT